MEPYEISLRAARSGGEGRQPVVPHSDPERQRTGVVYGHGKHPNLNVSSGTLAVTLAGATVIRCPLICHVLLCP